MREREGPAPQAWEGEGLAFRQLFQNRLDDPVGVRQNLIVPEPQYAPTLLLKPNSAPPVVVAVRVLTAICLDDETMSGAGEIDDKASNRILPPKAVFA